MSYELILLRHGKSDWDTNETDFNRPISDRGKRAAQRIGVWLAQNALKPDMIISSPAERARVTAQKMMKAMGETAHYIIFDQRLYDASLKDLLAVLKEVSNYTKRVILVGHNPGLEQLLSYLCQTKITATDNAKLLTTASIAHLALTCHWKNIEKNSANLITIQRPKHLPKKFPYPSYDGNELRKRPAYYYQQSSVIPYRYHNGELEVILILSSKKNHYVIPKGIKEPGLTARESAAKEALEEAGVIGNIGISPIGHYSYEKWGAECTVSVYPMEVTSMLDEMDWSESHRGREWLPASVAAEKLFQNELKPMIIALMHKLKT